MEQTWIPIIIGLIGVGQVIVSWLLAKRNNKAAAEKDEASAAETIGAAWKALVEGLQARIMYQGDRILILEAKCERYEKLLIQYEGMFATGEEATDEEDSDGMGI